MKFFQRQRYVEPTPGVSNNVGDSVLSSDLLLATISRSHTWLAERQQSNGSWVFAVDADQDFDAEWIVTHALLRRDFSPAARSVCNTIRDRQQTDGSWSAGSNRSIDMDRTILSCVALICAGDAPGSAHIERAFRAIRQHGGLSAATGSIHWLLACLGILSWSNVAAMPCTGLHDSKLLAEHSGAKSINASIPPFACDADAACIRRDADAWIWNHRPVCIIDSVQSIAERLRLTSVDAAAGRKSGQRKSLAAWQTLARALRRPLLRIVESRTFNRIAKTDLASIDSETLIRVAIAMSCCARVNASGTNASGTNASGTVEQIANQLEQRVDTNSDGCSEIRRIRMPVDDTALATLALRASGVRWHRPAVRRSIRWLRTCRNGETQAQVAMETPGDSTAQAHLQSPGGLVNRGWHFSPSNDMRDRIDSTSLALAALSCCLPNSDMRRHIWQADLLPEFWSPHESDRDASAVIAARADSTWDATFDVEWSTPILNSMSRGLRWLLRQQCSDGRWDPQTIGAVRWWEQLHRRSPYWWPAQSVSAAFGNHRWQSNKQHDALRDSLDATGVVIAVLHRMRIPHAHTAIVRGVAFIRHALTGLIKVSNAIGESTGLIAQSAATLAAVDFNGIESSASESGARDPLVPQLLAWLEAGQSSDGGWSDILPLPLTTNDASQQSDHHELHPPAGVDRPSRFAGSKVVDRLDECAAESSVVVTSRVLQALMTAATVPSTPEIERGILFLIDAQRPDGQWVERRSAVAGSITCRNVVRQSELNCLPLLALAAYARRTGRLMP